MVRIVTESAVSNRKIRRPQHTFQLSWRPWQIQPFMIAPVLAGETMRNLLLQARVVSDPLANPIIGWWFESYFFYVKLRDLDGRDDFAEMLMDPEKSISSYDEAANAQYYHGWTGVNWTKLALKRIVEDWFRADGEAWDTYVINGMPACSINRDSWADSLVSDTDYLANIAEKEVISLTGDAQDISAEDIHNLMQKWEWQRVNGLVEGELTFEEWLRMQGVRVAAADDDENRYRPELLRFVRNWTYPSNTIDPSDGSPSSAVSWAIAERADKDRFFSEPGFIVGVAVARPKVYMKAQSGSAAHLLTTAQNWLPSLLVDPMVGFKKMTEDQQILPATDDDYWIDLADLFMYGDQFLNFSLSQTGAGLVALPTPALQKRYPASTDADALFVNTEAGVGKLIADGVVSLMVASRLRDRSGTV